MFSACFSACFAPQAIEAKENLDIQNESITLASISYQVGSLVLPARPASSDGVYHQQPPGCLATVVASPIHPCRPLYCCPPPSPPSLLASPLQNFFRAYPKLAGMTGTAATESAEFSQIYNLPVTVVPPNRPVSREDNSDVVFRWVVRGRFGALG